MDVEATRSVRQAEVGSTLTMLDRTADRFDIRPDWLVADTAYGSEESLVEIVLKRQILPFIPVIDNLRKLAKLCPANAPLMQIG